MISCINGREFVKKNPEIEAILRNKNQRPKTINHSIALFVNGGALNVTYPLTGVMSLKGSSKTVTGFSFDPFGFQLQIDGGSASDQYANITSWLYDYEYNDQATLELCVPMFETNTVFPGMHKSKKEILRDRNNRL